MTFSSSTTLITFIFPEYFEHVKGFASTCPLMDDPYIIFFLDRVTHSGCYSMKAVLDEDGNWTISCAGQ